MLSLGLVTACNGGGGGEGPYGGEVGKPAAAASVKIADSGHGKILVDAEGRTLYLFDKDQISEPTCYDACYEACPPLVVRGDLRPGAGIDQELIGTTAREDGRPQVTYAGHPLYLYAKDRRPGDVEGQEVDEFGGGWYLVGPDGAKVES